MESGDNLEKLYEKYNVLSEAKDKITQHSQEYIDSIDGVNGNENEKMLSAQILSKFFKHFPDLHDKALNALFDLCEDDEARIRACAMRYLVSICKDCKDYICKVTDILAQMMQLDEQRDYTTASWCLLQLSKEDSINVLKTMFIHVHTLNNNLPAREKCIEFIYKKLIQPLQHKTNDVENIIVDQSKKILQNNPSSHEVVLILPCLKQQKYGKTQQGQQELIEIIGDVLELDQEFSGLEEENVDKVIVCTTHILPFFSAKNESSKFVKYYCDQILPHWDKIGALPNGNLRQLQLLHHLAELCTTCGTLENPSLYVVQIFDKLKFYMPQPPNDVDVTKMPNLEFSYVECLLYAFHRLARQCPDFLTHDPDVLKDFRSRLSYFSRGVQGCSKVLNNKNLKLNDQQSVKIKIAPSVLTNINLLVKDLFYQPPMYKCNVTLSFKNATTITHDDKTSNESSAPQKRHAPITFDNEGGHQHARYRSGDNVKLYQPPSGKFSNNFQNYDRGSGRSMRSRGRGLGNRGRGINRTWRN